MPFDFEEPTKFARHLRGASTPAEYLLWQLIRNRQRCKAKFRRQHAIGPYFADFCCPEANLVIECDGLPHFTEQGKERDERRTQRLGELGYAVLRFTSHEIEHETQQVLKTIDDALTDRLRESKTPHPPTPSPRSTEEKGS